MSVERDVHHENSQTDKEPKGLSTRYEHSDGRNLRMQGRVLGYGVWGMGYMHTD